MAGTLSLRVQLRRVLRRLRARGLRRSAMTKMGRRPGPSVQRFVGEKPVDKVRGVSAHIRRTVRPSEGCETCAHMASGVEFAKADLAKLAHRASKSKYGPSAKLLEELTQTKENIAERKDILESHRRDAHSEVSDEPLD